MIWCHNAFTRISHNITWFISSVCLFGRGSLQFTTNYAQPASAHMALRISTKRARLPWSAVLSSCSSSDGGLVCTRGLNPTGRTCWSMLKCCYISPFQSLRCQRGCSNAASPLQSPSSRYYCTMTVI